MREAIDEYGEYLISFLTGLAVLAVLATVLYFLKTYSPLFITSITGG